MSDKTETTAQVLDSVDKWGALLADTLKNHGQPVYELALQTAHLAVMSAIISNAFGAIVFGFIAIWAWKKMKANLPDLERDRGEGVIAVICCGALVAIGGGMFIGSVDALLNPLLWAALKNPEIWIAAKIAGLGK